MAEYVVKRPVNRPPIHPGELVREEVLPALGFSVSETARRLTGLWLCQPPETNLRLSVTKCVTVST